MPDVDPVRRMWVMAVVAEGLGTRFAMFAGARHGVLTPLSSALHSFGGYQARLIIERVRARVAAPAARRRDEGH
ncbi:hypothetical protein [Streptomyces sp. NPDC002467]|uniref:hypothetical protein n=1 Tax=Streptomyces sp. NPDC002467 TaxID=3364647 RepID=UPI0036A82729